MSAAEVVVVPTGTANLASIRAAFRRLGAAVVESLEAERIAQASHVVLPGVGAFAASIAPLRASGADAALVARIAADRPTLAVCVGHQLLFERSDESPGVLGLGVVPAQVGRFGGDVRIPQFGWNEVTGEGRLLRSGFAYFANSYRATEAPGWTVAMADHGGPFVAAMERGNVLTCQFHPELSGAYGCDLLAAWLAC
ncbi:MAG: imidazole glycerol phosphate synthase subunit HisH [Geminicoccaceae bacterium]|nr:MAG: imidazole glycerol phosphate synthase subunit HisH [Geminicoccaceae bacterium]